MKVLFVYKYLTLGGVEAVLRARLEGLPPQGIDARAWFLQGGDGRDMFTGCEDRVEVGDLAALAEFVARHSQDVVSVIDTPEAFPILEGHRATRVVVEVHSPYWENLEYLRLLEPRFAAGVWAPSAYQREVARRRLGRGTEVRVVPNALGEAFARGPRPFEPRPPRPIVAWVGRLDALKDWRGFVSMAGRIARASPEVEFWMAGDSPESGGSARLFRLAARAGVVEKLLWYRSLPHDRAPRWLDAVRESGGLVISTSRGESFGMAIAEAMARGCAVVAPSLGPFPELITHGESGLMYRPGSTAAGAAAARRFLSEPTLRADCGERARQAILKAHAPQAAHRELAKALRALAADSRPDCA